MKTRSIPSLLLSGLLLVLMSCSETPTGLDPANSNLYGAGIDAGVSLSAPQGRDVPLVRARFRRQRKLPVRRGAEGNDVSGIVALQRGSDLSLNLLHGTPKPTREFPRLCRGGGQSSTVPGVVRGYSLP